MSPPSYSSALLLSDTELAKDHAEQIVDGKFSGDFRERFLAQAQYFSQ